MRPNFEDFTGISYLVGDADVLNGMAGLPALMPFDGRMMAFLGDVSRRLMADREARAYSDVATFAFFIRRASTEAMRLRFFKEDGDVRVGRGMAFHVAPSNVAVNFAYSLAVGLLAGNANFVRVPSREFPQVELICAAIRDALAMEEHAPLRGYVCLARYGHEKGINDALSSICAARVVWGGDGTVAELRKSPLGPRAGEVTFADRYSIAVIDSDAYLREEAGAIARAFYDDTYLTDQNACTSPRMVAWTGSRIAEAKRAFWGALHDVARGRYALRPMQAVDKLAGACLAAASADGVVLEPREDNLVVRVRVPDASPGWVDRRGSSGYFLELDCEDVWQLRGICDDARCQTVGYVGSKEMFYPLLESGVRGVDRIVPVGHTMDFDWIWDGYNLYERLTRTVAVR